MSKKDVDHGRPRIVCTRMIESKTCDNRRRYYLDDIERIVIGGLRSELGTREAVAYFVRCYNDERRRAPAVSHDGRKNLTAELAAVERRIEPAVAAIIEGQITRDEARVHLQALRARRVEIAGQLAAIEAPAAIIKLKPAAVDSYLRDLERLEEVINADLADGDEGAAQAIRRYVTTVTVMPADSGEPPGIILRGSLLGFDPFPVVSHFGGQAGAG
jgi:site-specific DNA recombinase